MIDIELQYPNGSLNVTWPAVPRVGDTVVLQAPAAERKDKRGYTNPLFSATSFGDSHTAWRERMEAGRTQSFRVRSVTWTPQHSDDGYSHDGVTVTVLLAAETTQAENKTAGSRFPW